LFEKPGCFAPAFLMRGAFVTSAGELRDNSDAVSPVGRSRQTARGATDFQVGEEEERARF
jgi:hypothetical protein